MRPFPRLQTATLPYRRVSLANQRPGARPEPVGCTATSHEVSRPSGDVTFRVRSTRVYLPRHLPPLAFLGPPTVFSSIGLLALFHASVAHGVQRAAVTLTRQPGARRAGFPNVACYAPSSTEAGEVDLDSSRCAAESLCPLCLPTIHRHHP